MLRGGGGDSEVQQPCTGRHLGFQRLGQHHQLWQFGQEQVGGGHSAARDQGIVANPGGRQNDIELEQHCDENRFEAVRRGPSRCFQHGGPFLLLEICSNG